MIKIITVNKIKEKKKEEDIKEYTKRISKYTKPEIIEVPDIDFDINKTLETEKNSILKYIDNKDYIITLDIGGNEISSTDFASKMNDIFNHNSNITFIIGGSYGLHKDIKDLSNYCLSFSKMTFPHQLFRVMLLEQIYRIYKIINNETYHK